MDKRTLTALILMLVLYLAFDQFVWKPQRESARLAQVQEQVDESPAVEAEAEPPTVDATIPISDNTLAESEVEIEEYTMENDYLKVTFSNQGAVISSIQLKKYFIDETRPVDLIPENESILATGVYQGSDYLNLGTRSFSISPQSNDRNLIFYIGEKENPQVQKIYTLDDLYGIRLDTRVQGIGNVNGLRLNLDAGIADSEINTRYKNQDYRFMLYAEGEFMKQSLSKIQKNPPQGNFSSFGWAAVRSKYFTLALQEIEPPLSKSFSVSVNPNTKNPGFSIDSFHKDPKSSWEQSFVLVAGPADADILKGYGRQMENIAERGYNWLRWLTNFFAWFLSWLHSYVRNYGVVIIIFAFLLKIVLHPLSHKSMSTSLKMQEIQPQMQALQKKYKDDPKTLQVEMSKLYKEVGANPLSGCLPLLLQMPIFFALYNVLRYSLDMRNAGFVLWLKDLSEPDPYMILPILMGLFMIIQSKMMQPKPANIDDMDDRQKAAQSSQKMMTWIMPIMMFFIFRNMPAGLVLYWTVFNVFTVIQQYYLLKHHRNKE